MTKSLLKYELVYLATPYTKYDWGLENAFIAASQLSARLMGAGVRLFCPIVHTHPIAMYGGLNATDHDLWMTIDRPFMKVCDALCVGMLSGWQCSRGIGEEIKSFAEASKPIHYLNPFTMTLENANA